MIEFYTNLNAALDEELDMTFFSFDTVPSFPFEAKNISYVIKHTYTEEVVANVKKLAHHIRPALQTVIACQRRAYGFISTETEFPVTEQADNIDEVPVHNIEMESYCGMTAARIDKLKTVEAASKS